MLFPSLRLSAYAVNSEHLPRTPWVALGGADDRSEEVKHFSDTKRRLKDEAVHAIVESASAGWAEGLASAPIKARGLRGNPLHNCVRTAVAACLPPCGGVEQRLERDVLPHRAIMGCAGGSGEAGGLRRGERPLHP